VPIDLAILSRQLDPRRTVLLFGAGSSIPSGGMSAAELAASLSREFGVQYEESLTLSEVATIVEYKHSRRELMDFLRGSILKLKPSGSLLNLPLYEWKSIFTTNYDTLIEQSYRRSNHELAVYRSNFDFQLRSTQSDVRLFKLHGSIEEDISDGKKSRIIISVQDYDVTSDYRDILYSNFAQELQTGDVLIVGHSLADPDLKGLVDEAARLKREKGAPGKVFLLIYSRNEDRALIYEGRGIHVCFAGLDEFFDALRDKLPSEQLALSLSDDPLDAAPELRPTTIDAAHSLAAEIPDVRRMFNGGPASYGDIGAGITFERDLANRLEAQIVDGRKLVTYLLGAAGVGKTTIARQVLTRLADRGLRCWEHKEDFQVSYKGWKCVMEELRKRKEQGVCFIDNCHWHLREVNRVVDEIGQQESYPLSLLLVSTQHHWNLRAKSPMIFASGARYEMSQLSGSEIDSLLVLVDRSQAIRSFVEERFMGFSRLEKRNRLLERCGADMFVCMKHIFGFDRIDDIILQEYAELQENLQDIYRMVSAMEAAGVRVHRQLVIRTLGMAAEQIATILAGLAEIISEYTISEKHGLYGWTGRHEVIARTIAKYKFSDEEEAFRLFDNIVRNLNPSYDIELRTIRDMCDISAGIGRISDRTKQNILLRRMISIAPAERVPRHRLTYNLIETGQFEEAEAEIRIFEKELRIDSPMLRYKVRVMLRRAQYTKGIMTEDRAAIIREAAGIAEMGVQRFSADKNAFKTFFEVGVAYLRLTGKWTYFDAAMEKAREAESVLLDPDLRRIISRFEAVALRASRGHG
jgi:SIR2-like domain